MTDKLAPTDPPEPAPLAVPAPLSAPIELEDTFADASLEMTPAGDKFRVGSVAGKPGVLQDPQVANKLKTGNTVTLAAAAPTSGQVLTATGPSAAGWATPAPSAGGSSAVVDGQLLLGSETATIVAGKDPSNNAQFMATETDGSVRVSDGGGSLTVDATALPLPAGAATETTLAARLTEATFTARTPTLGAKTSAGSSPVVLASDQAALPITDNAGSITVDGAVTANIGTTNGLALDATVSARLAEATFTTRVPTVGQKTMAGASPVVIASDQSAVTVSGTVTANIGTSSLALDATLTSGSQKAVARGGAKGATTAADLTSTAEGTDHQALDVQLYHGGAAVNPTAVRALTAADVVTAAQGTPAALASPWPVKVTDGTNVAPTGDAAARAVYHRVTDGTSSAAVKAASTAAVAADPALVVAVSPNNTVPVSGTVTANIGTAGTLALDATVSARLGTLGQKAMAASTPVVVASDQSAIPVSGTVTAGQGTAAAASGAWPTKLTDGTNIAAVKASGTAPTTSDPAVVVAISPNIGTKVTDGTYTAGVKAASTAATGTEPALVVAVSPNTAVKSAVPSVGYAGQFTVNAGAGSTEFVYSDGGGANQTLQCGIEIRCDSDSPGHLLVKPGGAASNDYTTSAYRVYPGQAVFFAIAALNALVVQGSAASSKGSYIAS